MSNTPHFFWLKLCQIPGLGALRLKTLSEAFSWNDKVDTDVLENLTRQFPGAIRHKVLSVITQKDLGLDSNLEKWLAWQETDGCHLVSLPEPDYPALLRLLPDPPAVLFLKGNLELLTRPQIAMVGSRNPTAQGGEDAFAFARSLSKGGFTITSGLAKGIDSAAHRGALKDLGGTIAVMGTGIDVIYPACNRELAEKITGSGLLVSELPLGTAPKASNFPKRNRIISGLALGTLVVEASIRSGSLITARLANEQNREVFALPGSIHNPQARGCHHLIKQGAKLVESVDDLFIELPALMQLYQQLEPLDKTERAVDTPAHQKAPTSAIPESAKPGTDRNLEEVSNRSTLILEAVDFHPTHPDQVVARTGLPVAEVQAMLMQLEIEGLIRSENGGVQRLQAV